MKRENCANCTTLKDRAYGSIGFPERKMPWITDLNIQHIFFNFKSITNGMEKDEMMC